MKGASGVSDEQWQHADEEVRKNLPMGVKLVRTLRGHTSGIERIAWSPDGRLLASPSDDKTIRLWDVETGKCLRLLQGHNGKVNSVAFDPAGRVLASGGQDDTIRLWELASGKMLHELKGHRHSVLSVEFSPAGDVLASGSVDDTVRLWQTSNGQLLHTFKYGNAQINEVAFHPMGQVLAYGSCDYEVKLLEATGEGSLLNTIDVRGAYPWSIKFDPQGRILAIGSDDKTISLWQANGDQLLRTLEGHTGSVKCVAFLSNGRIVASKGADSTIRLWSSETGICLGIILEPTTTSVQLHAGLVFHPSLPLLATVGSDPDSPDEQHDCVIHIWELDLDTLLGQTAIPSVTYTSAKIVLVGDSGVGKTGLGWRLAHGEFKEHSSTHGQQFWLLNPLCKQRRDGAQCEAVLWDLAGQHDYRLIHALFLDDADLALILFDPTHNVDPLSGVEFWLKQLKVEERSHIGPPTILVAARSDRGTSRLTKEELDAFCQQRGIRAYLSTSAKDGEGIEELIQKMRDLIPWDDKPATVTTETFKRIKDSVLDLKENSGRRKTILTQEELRERLEKTDRIWKFSDDEMLTAVGHLVNHGYVTRLKTSEGQTRILLVPELLNNLAASFVLEARRNKKGLGSLEEDQLQSRGYEFPELEMLTEAEKDIMLDSAAVLFLEHNICFRETDPLNGRAYLFFPELINLNKPQIGDDVPTEDGAVYTVSGAIENVYASIVVLMGYTQTFTRTNQWRNHARYEVGMGFICGLRLEEERPGELDFVLYFSTSTPPPVRRLFQSLFENFLARRNLKVQRFESVVCPKGHPLIRAVVRERMSRGAEFVFCNLCGSRITLQKADEPIYLTKPQAEKVEANRRAADRRSRFEQLLFRLKSYVTEQRIVSPECFISYAWGDKEQERWVERNLAMDLQKAGVIVVLDRWENARIGSSMSRFMERVNRANRVIIVGTPLYRKKYSNNEPMGIFVAASERDLIGKRIIGTEAEKESVMPVLLKGTENSAFPPLLQSRVYADFRKSDDYFASMFELILSIYGIPPQSLISSELRKLSQDLEVKAVNRNSQQFHKLLDSAKTGTKTRQRLAAVRKLTHDWNKMPGTFDTLIELAQIDQDELIRRAALQEVARQFPDQPSTLPLLENSLASDPSPDVRQAAAIELARGWKEFPKVRQLLEVRAAQDPDESVRSSILREFTDKWRYSLATLRSLNESTQDASSDISDFANKELKAIRTERSDQWIRWLNAEDKIEDFDRLPEVADGFPCVRVQAIHLKNIGPFANTGEIWLKEQRGDRARLVTLILGDNAAGKSTLLRSISLALLGSNMALLADDDPERRLYLDSLAGSIDLLCELHLDEYEMNAAPATFRVAIEIEKGQRKFQNSRDSHHVFGDHNAAPRLDWLRERKYEQFGFMCAYGALRNLNEENDPQPDISDDLIARVLSLFRSSASLLNPDLLNLLLKGSAIRLKGGKEIKLEPNMRKEVMSQLASLLPSLSEADPSQSSAVALHGVPLLLPELSEGYSSFLALVGHLYCHALASRSNSDKLADIWGLVLIDEIDLHLHPAWQRSVMPDLQKTFPNMQIIATTHSPIIAGSVDPDSIIVLRREDSSIRVIPNIQAIEGWRTDQILTSDLFGLPTSRNILTEQIHKEYAHLLSEKGPEDPSVRKLGKRLNELMGYDSEGGIDKQTNEALDEFLRERFSKLDDERRKLILASAGLKLAN